MIEVTKKLAAINLLAIAIKIGPEITGYSRDEWKQLNTLMLELGTEINCEPAVCLAKRGLNQL